MLGGVGTHTLDCSSSRNSKHKAPEATIDLVCFQSCKEARVVEKNTRDKREEMEEWKGQIV